jgi:hypothetical protein
MSGYLYSEQQQQQQQQQLKAVRKFLLTIYHLTKREDLSACSFLRSSALNQLNGQQFKFERNNDGKSSISIIYLFIYFQID